MCAASGRIETLDDIGNTVLAVSNGTPVLVKNLGRVRIGIAPRLGEFGYMDRNDAVEGVILMRTGEKTQNVLQRIEAKTREINASILPPDVKVHPFYDLSNLIHDNHASRANATCCTACCWSSSCLFFSFTICARD